MKKPIPPSELRINRIVSGLLMTLCALSCVTGIATVYRIQTAGVPLDGALLVGTGLAFAVQLLLIVTGDKFRRNTMKLVHTQDAGEVDRSPSTKLFTRCVLGICGFFGTVLLLGAAINTQSDLGAIITASIGVVWMLFALWGLNRVIIRRRRFAG